MSQARRGAEVVAGDDKDAIDGITGGAGKETSAAMAVPLHVANDRLDAGAPPDDPMRMRQWVMEER